MKKMISIIVSIIALTVLAPGHAKAANEASLVEQVVTTAGERLDALVHKITDPWINFKVTKKDIECLARNIFHEAANESEEGKAAVGIVTINRVKDSRFGKTICDVVHQRTVLTQRQERSEVRVVKTGYFGLGEERQVHKTVVTKEIPVCQFSWSCMTVRKPKTEDERWLESQQVAARLLDGEYIEWQTKYNNAMWFHATSIRPIWAKTKQRVERIGGHIFYAER